MDLRFHKSFRKEFKKLPPKIRNQFGERLQLFVEDKFDPLLNNHAVDAAFPGCRSINVSGDYRAIFYEEDRAITFIKIGRHARLYS